MVPCYFILAIVVTGSCQEASNEMNAWESGQEIECRISFADTRLLSTVIPHDFSGEFFLAHISPDHESVRRFFNLNCHLSTRYNEMMSLGDQPEIEDFTNKRVTVAMKFNFGSVNPAENE